jgi:Protein of unknown function (DUF2750)
MFRNTADAKADVVRFIRRVIESDTVWYLTSDIGTAYCDSNAELDDDEEESATVLLFFSDHAYAKRAQAQNYPTHRPESMTLFDFIYRWLPGMSDDGALAGPNWTGDLIGLELDPFELREAIESAMDSEHLKRYENMYQDLS